MKRLGPSSGVLLGPSRLDCDCGGLVPHTPVSDDDGGGEAVDRRNPSRRTAAAGA